MSQDSGVDRLGNIEHWIDARVAEAEDYLTARFGEPSHEEEWTEVLQEVVGPFADQLRGAVGENERLRAALEFYAEEDSEFDVGGVDGGRRALEALGLPLGGQ